MIEIERQLEDLGLSKNEAVIYMALVKLGKATVKEIAKATGMHRTNIYDILEKLKEKGLVSYFKEKNIQYFIASHPRNLESFLKEKLDLLHNILPKLIEIYNIKEEEVIVEIFKGKQGMKSAFRDILRSLNKGGVFYGYSVGGQLREYLPIFSNQFQAEMKRKKIKYYGIYVEGTKKPAVYTEIRYVPKEMASPVAIFLYSDKVFINIWKPTLIGIIIRSKEVFNTYKKHFNLLWKIAKKN